VAREPYSSVTRKHVSLYWAGLLGSRRLNLLQEPPPGAAAPVLELNKRKDNNNKLILTQQYTDIILLT